MEKCVRDRRNLDSNRVHDFFNHKIEYYEMQRPFLLIVVLKVRNFSAIHFSCGFKNIVALFSLVPTKTFSVHKYPRKKLRQPMLSNSRRGETAAPVRNCHSRDQSFLSPKPSVRQPRELRASHILSVETEIPAEELGARDSKARDDIIEQSAKKWSRNTIHHLGSSVPTLHICHQIFDLDSCCHRSPELCVLYYFSV
jgi:hypothetical protein